ncbi:hypothetical protein A2477_01085 [Candidatus Falkowbacteria bacterium RIFOXYC2_FULL_47_12]|nr:MAG: hypothetical protein A2477_01085 [Candidatus Falkowbacteria bacterium RIFOXYC2_FULL_47_12]
MCHDCYEEDQVLAERVKLALQNRIVGVHEICEQFEVAPKTVFGWLTRGAIPRGNVEIRCPHCGKSVEECNCGQVYKLRPKPPVANTDADSWRWHSGCLTLMRRREAYKQESSLQKPRERFFTPGIGRKKIG